MPEENTQPQDSAATDTGATTDSEGGETDQAGGEPGQEVVESAPAAVLVRDFDATDIEAIAAVCNDANAAYCQAIDDPTYGVWALVPDDIKASCRAGVEYRLKNLGSTPEEQHEAWLAGKKAEGWAYGPVKSDETKQHPCMVPYADLPQAQRVKDYLFRGLVDSVARSLGLLSS